jgi:diguanylate cyclase (GGDEF)-like protein
VASYEQLCEALNAIKLENERLRGDAAHAVLLLHGLESLLRIEDELDPFPTVFALLKTVFGFEQALVLAEVDEGRLDCIAAAPHSLLGTSWGAAELFKQVMDGRVSAKISSHELEEWRDPPAGLFATQPALYAPLRVHAQRGVLVLLRALGAQAFDHTHIALAEKFALLASHAMATREASRAETELLRQRAIEASQKQLAEQNFLLDKAINNMTQGLIMFDATARIIVCNQRYVDMYGMSSEIVKPGCTLRRLLDHRIALGNWNEDPDQYSEKLLTTIAKGKNLSIPTELSDGRTIIILNRPMGDGGWVATHEDITERRESERRILHMAHCDNLTDLPNRVAFNEYFAKALAEAAATSSPLAILSLDLDRFKEANDAHGHSIGDALLREVAHRLREAAGSNFLARVGGDEFMLIMPGGPQPAAAAALAERLIAAFADDFEVDGQRLRIGLSVGGAVYPTDGTDAKTLMVNADAALYRAKNETRGSALFFDPEMSARLRERRALQEDLRSAIERSELLLHYQPQFRMDGEVVGFEALLRWQCLKRGSVSPGVFVPIAEANHLIIAIGEWVLREACREAASWDHPVTIAVNISPVQFRRGDLPSLVHAILLETGLTPGRLELEITEGVFIEDFSHAVSILRRLKALGVQIALDDFGTGYSSLSYLHAFSFDKIKVDRAFVSDLEANRHSIAIVRAVINLGRSLSIPVLAEGVETKAQHSFLTKEGCDQVQGYLTGRPALIETYAEIVGGEPARRSKMPAAG